MFYGSRFIFYFDSESHPVPNFNTFYWLESAKNLKFIFVHIKFLLYCTVFDKLTTVPVDAFKLPLPIVYYMYVWLA